MSAVPVTYTMQVQEFAVDPRPSHYSIVATESAGAVVSITIPYGVASPASIDLGVGSWVAVGTLMDANNAVIGSPVTSNTYVVSVPVTVPVNVLATLVLG